MDVDESCPLLPQQSELYEPYPRSDGSRKTSSSPSKALSIALALFGVFLASADEQLVMATYGAIASDFQNLSDGSWLLTGYNLGYCIALPVYGRISDAYGCKKPLLAAYCLFGLGCIITGTALSLWQAIAGRVISGIGGSGMIALISVIIIDIVPLDQVGVLRSYVNVAAIAGRSSGGPLGGFLADTIGWRWSFLGQAPIAIICSFLAGWQLPLESFNKIKIESHSDNTNHTSAGSGKLYDEDFLGGIMFSITITIFLLVLGLGGQKVSWDDPIIIYLAATCVVFGTAFVMREGLWAKKPLIPLWLMRRNGVGVFCVVQILLFSARFAFLSNLAPYFVRTEDANNTAAAAYIVPSSLGNAIGALLAGYVISRTYRYKALSLVSLAIGALSYVLVGLRWRHGTNLWESLYTFPAGLSFGMILSTQFIGLSASAPKPQTATAVSTYYLSQQVGILVGVGASAAILRMDFRKTLLRQLENYSDRDWIIQGVLRDSRFANSLPRVVQSIVRSSYLHSFQSVPILATCCSIMALPLIVCTREQSLRGEK